MPAFPQNVKSFRLRKKYIEGARPIDKEVLITDFTVGLINNSITHGGVVDYMKKLHHRKGFSFVVPKKYLRHIRCKYNSEDIDHTKEGHSHYDKSIKVWSNF